MSETNKTTELLKEFYNRMQAELEREPINRARYMIALHEIYKDLKSKIQ